MNGNSIKVEKHLRYLGITLDFKLSWAPHIEHISSRTGLIFQAFAQVARRDWGLSPEALSTIYDGIFIPIATYGCGTWGSAISKVHIRRKLVSAQRRALLLLTKAYRTTSNVSLQAIARKLPIDIEISMKTKMQQAKWGTNIQIGDITIESADIERPHPFGDTITPTYNFSSSWNNLNNASIQIYTDGSGIDGGVGCAYVVYDNSEEIHNQKFRLHPQCNVFQAELLAISKATNWINNTYSNFKIDIYTDSLSALKMIYSIKLHPLAVEIRNNICVSNNNIQIFWVRSHQGMEGNERADALAKEAALDPNISYDYGKISQGTLKRLLREEAIDTWQSHWNELGHHIIKQFIPDLRQHNKIKWFTPDHYTTQFLSNHGKFAHYLARFVNRTSDECPTCGVRDGANHYLYDCTITAKERTEMSLLLNEINIDWPCDLTDIWKSQEIFHAFKRLAKKTILTNNQLLQDGAVGGPNSS
ncbi:uncharacterized protein [Centruroides vittatus]|uniref:uncharacterized protein n=1 Tax=Centruroides vittatus TaxID=120091 RepID=UPI00350EFBE6